ncbi:hypothetical protein SLEP1_g43696 [Rubroshorea leprosula]|uniref:Uncharacterized protein n=1 Tax=Rubroshorea leprosula TaxID=152421 RepID=A0AAV5LED5_9ROSI|nr:hypothetical protein SLEP1_g43696 [Rubroshorea leprosula]
MYTRGWRSSYRMLSFLDHIRCSSNVSQLHRQEINTVVRARRGYPGHQGLQLFSAYRSGMWSKKDNKVNVGAAEGSGPPPPPAPRFNFPIWARWILGSLLTFLLPFWKQKWAKWRRIEKEAEMVVGGVEIAAEVVEKVATATEKASEKVAANLSDDSKLKEAALLVERVSKETAKDARLTEDIIHKVEAIKKDATDLEKFVEPIVHKIMGKGHEGDEQAINVKGVKKED